MKVGNTSSCNLSPEKDCLVLDLDVFFDQKSTIEEILNKINVSLDTFKNYFGSVKIGKDLLLLCGMSIIELAHKYGYGIWVDLPYIEKVDQLRLLLYTVAGAYVNFISLAPSYDTTTITFSKNCSDNLCRHIGIPEAKFLIKNSPEIPILETVSNAQLTEIEGLVCSYDVLETLDKYEDFEPHFFVLSVCLDVNTHNKEAFKKIIKSIEYGVHYIILRGDFLSSKDSIEFGFLDSLYSMVGIALRGKG